MEEKDKPTFDDSGNEVAQIADISRIVLDEFLAITHNPLFEDVSENHITLQDALLRMNLLDMRGEDRKIKNVALFMFSPHPEKFFPGARIDINVYSQDKETLTHRDSYKGPVWLALHNALEYIHQMHILKFIHKPKDDAHSVVTYNWPFVAVEEALTNAVRHRDYSLNKPINVNIYHDRIEIVNYGDKGNNSRLGKFMSALKLTRENGSGLRYIIEAMERNGSPKPWLDYNEAIPNYKVVLQKREEINI